MVSPIIPLDVYEAAVRVAGEALYWKSSLKRIFRTSGVSENAAIRYEALSKYAAMRAAWDDLDRVGTRGHLVQKNIIQALANIEKPDPKADQRAGNEALSELRRLVKKNSLLVDPLEAEAAARKKAMKDSLAAVSTRREGISRLNETFRGLQSSTDRHARGYAFERLLSDLFRLHEYDFASSYRTEIDQVDGALTVDGFTYLLEARWRQVPAVDGDLADLANKVSRRLVSTRGLFISMAGFREEVVSLYRLSHDSKLILMDGEDLAVILDQRISLVDALKSKIQAASIDGEPLLRLAAL